MMAWQVLKVIQDLYLLPKHSLSQAQFTISRRRVFPKTQKMFNFAEI
jgi:hypothetical protein